VTSDRFHSLPGLATHYTPTASVCNAVAARRRLRVVGDINQLFRGPSRPARLVFCCAIRSTQYWV